MDFIFDIDDVMKDIRAKFIDGEQVNFSSL